VEKALCQMRMPRPETTRGTLNVTLAAHPPSCASATARALWVTMIVCSTSCSTCARAGRRVAPPRARREGLKPLLLDLLN
jgi:hypothetical protein